MLTDETAISNLLYRYAEYIDSGDLAGAANLFSYAHLKMREEDAQYNHEQILEFWQSAIKIYPCGTPRTKHVVTNPIIEIDGDRANVRSYYTVFQQTEGLALQAIAAGRYHDEFKKIDGDWHFSYRNYSLLDFVGDLSHHLMPDLLKQAT